MSNTVSSRQGVKALNYKQPVKCFNSNNFLNDNRVYTLFFVPKLIEFSISAWCIIFIAYFGISNAEVVWVASLLLLTCMNPTYCYLPIKANDWVVNFGIDM